MKRIRNYKKITLLTISIILILISVIIMPNSFAYQNPVKTISFSSQELDYEKNEAGSYKITKSAEWIGKGKARITFQVDTKELIKENTNTDTILIIDISDSMTGNKMDKVKQDSIDLIQKTLQDNNNKIGIIEFNNNASIVSNLSNDVTDLTNKINNLTTLGSTNYYQALVKLDELLKTYQKEENRELTVLFLTDGLPNINTPNEVGQYKYLKSEYPYLSINGIQYEMGDTIINQLKEVSDNQYLAFQDNLGEILGESSITPIHYEKFQIVDYIDNDYYTLNSVDDIKVSDGEVKLEEENGVQKITWTIPNYLSGRKTKLTMDISLKDAYIGQAGVYPTNKSEQVISKIKNQTEDVNSNLTPSLAEKYQVIYDGNAPEGSSVENIPESESQSVFDTIEITEEEPTCKGYIFQGWEIVTDNVKKVGSDYFIMPEVNVTLRAKWSKIELAKSMDGVVSEQGDPIMKGFSWWTRRSYCES